MKASVRILSAWDWQRWFQKQIYFWEKRWPGASSKSKSPPTLIHFRLLVTPGLGALSHALFFKSLLIRALFPMLGNPITQALTGRPFKPLAFLFALISELNWLAAFATYNEIVQSDLNWFCIIDNIMHIRGIVVVILNHKAAFWNMHKRPNSCLS